MASIVISNLGKAYKKYPTRWARLLEWFLPISKPNYNLKWVLHDVSFTVYPGDAIGIIGVNGAGKSTLLKLITGIIQPTEGSVHVRGHVASLLELGIGFHPDFTGRQNVYMAAFLLGYSKAEIDCLMPEIEDFSGIGEYIDLPVRIYSSGMQMRLAFSIATAKRPDVLIVDEALSVGDAYFQHKCFSKIRFFQENGTTLLFVSHDIATVLALCNKCAWIESGSLMKFGKTKDVINSYSSWIYAKEQNIDNASRFSKKAEIFGKRLDKPKRDCRLDFINNSNLRNEIRVLEFNEEAARWGEGLAKITSVWLQDLDGTQLSWVIGGEEVILVIETLAMESLSDVIVGFQVRDKLGQILFGDNTYITMIETPLNIRAKNIFRTKFRFLMPLLPNGTYAVTAAVVTGTQKEHIVHDWLNESIFFESHNEINNGLVGIPMQDIEIEELDENIY